MAGTSGGSPTTKSEFGRHGINVHGGVPVSVPAKLQSERWYVRGRESLEKGHTHQAIDCFRRSLRLNPYAFTVMRLLGQAYLNMHDGVRAMRLLRRAADARPQSLRVRYLLGRLDIVEQQWKPAVRQLGEAVQLRRFSHSPLRPLIHFYLAVALTKLRAGLAAGRQYARFLHDASLPLVSYQYSKPLQRLRRNALEIQMATAENFLRARAARRALYWFRSARRRMPNNAFINGRIAALLSRLGHRRRARGMALRLVRQSAAAPDSLRLLIWMYQGAGAATTLGNALQNATAHGHEKAAAWLAAARLLQLSNRPRAAMKAFAASFFIQPRQERALKKFLLLARMQNQTNAGLSALMFAVARDVHPLPVNRLLTSALGATPGTAAIKKIVAIRPRNTLPGQVLAQLHARRGMYSGPRMFLAALAAVRGPHLNLAKKYFTAAVQRLHPHWNLYRAFAQALFNARRFAAADRLLQSRPALAIGGWRNWRMRISGLIAQRRLPAALSLARRCARASPKQPALALQAVKILLMQGRPHAALRVLKATTARFGHNQPAFRQILAVAGRLHDHALAKRALSKMITNFPQAAAGQWAAGVLAFDQNRLGRAAHLFQALVVNHPGNIGYAVWLGQMELAGGRRAEAFQLLKSELLENPGCVRLAGALAQILQATGHGRLAIAVLKKMAAQNPQSARHWELLAAFLARNGQPRRATAVLRRAVAAAPDRRGFYRLDAKIQARRGAMPAAIKTLRSAIKAHGASPGRLVALAALEARTGNCRGAIKLLVRAHHMLPWNYAANNLLARLLAKQGKHLGLANRFAHRALLCQPNNPRFLDTQGWILYKQGHMPLAIRWFRRALSHPGAGHLRATVHLGDALYRLGKRTQAVAQWRLAAKKLAAQQTKNPARRALGRRLAMRIQKAVRH